MYITDLDRVCTRCYQHLAVCHLCSEEVPSIRKLTPIEIAVRNEKERENAYAGPYENRTL